MENITINKQLLYFAMRDVFDAGRKATGMFNEKERYQIAIKKIRQLTTINKCNGNQKITLKWLLNNGFDETKRAGYCYYAYHTKNFDFCMIVNKYGNNYYIGNQDEIGLIKYTHQIKLIYFIQTGNIFP